MSQHTFEEARTKAMRMYITTGCFPRAYLKLQEGNAGLNPPKIDISRDERLIRECIETADAVMEKYQGKSV
ncbi:hypothetical protein JW851_04110 [Candidatus Woesearchaeota archaeon]|nr:hypothetical protein [Candidatus Woesearchaeota archaeon]